MLLLRVKWNNELRNNQMKIKKGFIKAIFLLNLSTFFGLFSFGQSDNYSEKLDRYRKSFFKTFFDTETEIDANTVFGKRDIVGKYYWSKDSMAVPIDYEYTGRSYFRKQGIAFDVAIKKTKLMSKNVDTLGCYFFFEYTHTDEFDTDAYVNRNDIWDSLENEVKLTKNHFQNLKANQLLLLQDNETNRYYISSQKSSGIVTVNMKKLDRDFLQKNGYSIEQEKLDAIFNFLETLRYNYEVKGGMKELSLNHCYPISD